jgi:hypothetical protein
MLVKGSLATELSGIDGHGSFGIGSMSDSEGFVPACSVESVDWSLFTMNAGVQIVEDSHWKGWWVQPLWEFWQHMRPANLPPFPPPFLNLCLRKDGWCPSKVTNNYLCTVKSVCQSKSPLYICTVAGAAVIFLLNICALVFPATFIQVTGHIVVNLETDFMLC